uniref:Cyclic nucleotide-binding domain-containing protein n=1 Tax=Romanomermis culicivorax TaxID=13658 RepID=A0A915KFY3_ROMCU
MFWLAFVSMSFLYNAFAIPLRAAYPYQTEENLPIWMCFDYISDLIYLIDVIFVKTRIRFMKDGLPVKDVKVLAKRYLNSWQFKLCILSLMPTDLLYLTRLGPNSLFRLNRLLKITSYWEFFLIMDNVVKNPYAVRVLKTLLNLIYVIHVNSCVFYALSSWEGIGSNTFVYTGKGNAYLRCFYFATKLATSVGNTEDPTNVLENVFMLISWLKGVFIVAILLGQIRDIVATATKNREEFRNVMDDVMAYCNLIKLPDDGRLKVQHWFSYTWEEQKTLGEYAGHSSYTRCATILLSLDENKFLTSLPKKLRTELAISVHYDVLNKVQLFKDCDKALLRDLVLKLKPVLFLPGDYICKKGEIGKEMYIVSKGILEVIGGPNGTTVFATLREGSVFGEVSLLAIGGGNRRTADVRSKGFSNLFILSKDDLNEAIKDHPEAQKVLKHKARKLLRKHEVDVKDEKLDMEQTSVVTARPPTPKLLLTVAQVLNPNSPTGQQLLNRLSSISPPILNESLPNQRQFLSLNDAAKNHD